MHFDDGAVEGDGFDFDADDLFVLQTLEEPVENARLTLPVHAGVPVAKAQRQSPPFASLFGNI
jgi:hypothetical protein